MQSKTETKWLKILLKAANAGRKAILTNYHNLERRTVIGHGIGGDLTLKIDQVSEIAIHRSLLRDLEDQPFVFVSEEIGETKLAKDGAKPVIVCDPLDGSHNAQVGIPLFAVSLSVLGLKRKIGPSEPRRFGDVDIGVIRSVLTSDEFTAINEKGAFHNGSRLSKNSGDYWKEKRIETLEIECGDVNYLKRLLRRFTPQDVYKTRTLGSASLGFSLLANGTVKGFIFAQPGGARTIDSPAGYLIAKEAGRVMTDLSGKVTDLNSVEVGFHSRMNILGASDEKVHSRLLSMVSRF